MNDFAYFKVFVFATPLVAVLINFLGVKVLQRESFKKLSVSFFIDAPLWLNHSLYKGYKHDDITLLWVINVLFFRYCVH